MISTARQTQVQLEDPLDYLLRRNAVDYRRGCVIHDEQHPLSGLCLVVKGRVKVVAADEDGSESVTGIFCTDEFFGESTLNGEPPRERVTAMENTTLMSWTRAEIEAQIERQPKLGLALIQMLAQRCQDLGERMESLALHNTPERLVHSLIRFGKAGTPEPDGAIRIPPLTHELLSGYLGTSREVVTMNMNQLRRWGYVRYSRKAIQIYPEALAEHLRTQQTSI